MNIIGSFYIEESDVYPHFGFITGTKVQGFVWLNLGFI